jgi:hypothetical protein
LGHCEREDSFNSSIPWKIMIVDDEPEVHEVTRMAMSSLEFEGRPLEFVDAYSAQEAREKMQDDIALSRLRKTSGIHCLSSRFSLYSRLAGRMAQPT